MNWLTNFVRPKLRELVGRKDIPENLWQSCPSCGQMIFHRDLEANLRVCQHCGHHMRIGVRQRLEILFDGGEYQEIEVPDTLSDPLKFKDLKRYSDRLKEYQARTGSQDALVVAHGKMGGMNVVIAAFNFEFMGGSMGIGVGEALIAAGRLAVVQDAALIVVPASGGARMQEGILSLMQMARTTLAVDEVKDAGLPYIVLLTDPTTGGVSASFAMLGDIAVAEPGAVIGFAGRRVIEETIREQLPDEFQTAEYLMEHGMVDMVVRRHDLRETLVRIIGLLRHPGPSATVVPLMMDGEEGEPVVADTDNPPTSKTPLFVTDAEYTDLTPESGPEHDK
ncbi:acetyl-CoA carboxylase, carboxyltransferase subunit beta [Magnetospira sp. QH-2]|uniref:acetyl-CoA carboxylase, carboxyltransferase subunit beta n=1 Tax=Magnetospira sp. (strain QH-2) TaxID=1288970 RepID=UPI0003E81A8C|nr:acetyl-CoA carboxylase, carboxyltransferase subunit beta [Magnetospira sp. QH-2]CCQ72594.1 Acetyl-coenzyme A carboxylase carboxyl transferase subunit beta (ACCase beta chain) [Magnetospira sp. QH-2]